MKNVFMFILLAVIFTACGGVQTRVVEVASGDTVPIEPNEKIEMPQQNITSIQATEDGMVINVTDGGVAGITITQIESIEETSSTIPSESTSNEDCYVSAGTYEEYSGACSKGFSYEECKELICEIM